MLLFSRLFILLVSLAGLVWPQTGMISTYAGGGPAGDSLPLYGALAWPVGVVTTPTGDVYFTAVEAVYKVSGGVLTLVAGTPGSRDYTGDGGSALRASFNSPQGLAIDSSGNVYVADYDNNCIRKVTAATGVITTIVGTGVAGYSGENGLAASAQLNHPQGVAVDASGNIYIADSGNNRIRKVTAGTGIIFSIAGSGVTGFSGDGGLATNAVMNFPRGLALDASGNVYIADTYNNRIRKLNVGTGVISTVVGNGFAAFLGDGGPATAASLQYPYGLAVDALGNMYVADTGNNRIRKVTAATGLIATVAGNGTSDGGGEGGPAISAGLRGPEGVAVSNTGDVFLTDFGNGCLKKVAAGTGLLATVAGNGSVHFGGDGGPAGNAGMYAPTSVTIDAGGNVFIADTNNDRIRKVAAGTGLITTVAGNGVRGYSGDGSGAIGASLNGPSGLATDSAGNVYIAEPWNSRVRKLDVISGVITTAAGGAVPYYSGDGQLATNAGLDSPQGVAVAPNGDLYIADHGDSRVRKVAAATGVITTFAGSGTNGFSGDGGAATSARLSLPTSVAIDTQGNVYIADAGNHRVRKVSAATGIISTVAGSGASGYSGDGGAATGASLQSPQGVAVDASGNLYISDQPTQRVRKVAAGSGIITTMTGTGIAGYSGDGGQSGSARVSSPAGVALDASGALYIADAGNNRIRKVTTAAPMLVPTTTSVTSSNLAALVSDTVTITVSVTPSQATGLIELFDNGKSLGVTPLQGGSAVVIFSGGTQAAGTHAMLAVYAGDSQYLGSSSAVLSQQITAPLVISGTPVVMNGASVDASNPGSQRVTTTYFHPQGAQTLGVINVLINGFLDGRQACYLAYARASNVLYIVPDNGDGSQVTGNILGSSNTLRNSQCVVNLATSTKVENGNVLTLALDISFLPVFGGNKVIYAAARDIVSGNSGWQTTGTLTVPGAVITYPRPLAVSPGQGALNSASITFTYADASNANNLQTAWGLINNALDGRNACYFAYYIPGNQLYLIPDNGDGSKATSMVLTGSNSVSNSQCTINAQGAQVVKSGNLVSLTLPITFKSAFAGFKGVWLADQTLGGAATSAWHALGWWQVPGQ